MARSPAAFVVFQPLMSNTIAVAVTREMEVVAIKTRQHGWRDAVTNTDVSPAEINRLPVIEDPAKWCPQPYRTLPRMCIHARLPWWAKITDGASGFRVAAFCSERCMEKGRHSYVS